MGKLIALNIVEINLVAQFVEINIVAQFVIGHYTVISFMMTFDTALVRHQYQHIWQCDTF